MASVEELIVKLSADNADLKAKLKDSEKGIGNFGGVVSKLGPMIAGAFAVGSIVNFAKASFAAYEQQEKANKSLLSALNNNTFAYKELTAQAEQLRSTTGVDDAAIMQIQQLGAGAGKTTEEIKKITEASVQLAAKTGQDLQGAYMQLNATLNGSAGRLARLDTDFTKLTEEQLKNGGAIDLVIGKYGTFAQETVSQTELLKSNFGELQESIGYAFSGGVLSNFISGLNDAIISATKLMGVLNNSGKTILSDEQNKNIANFNKTLLQTKGKVSEGEWAAIYAANLKQLSDEARKTSDEIGSFEMEIQRNEEKGFFSRQQLTAEGKKAQERERAALNEKMLYNKELMKVLEGVDNGLLKGNETIKAGTSDIEKQIPAIDAWVQEWLDAEALLSKMEPFNVPAPNIPIETKYLFTPGISGGAIENVPGEKGKKGGTGLAGGALAQGQKDLRKATEASNEALQRQINSMGTMAGIMTGFGDAATSAFGKQSAASKAFAIGEVIASTSMAIMGTWAGYGKYGFMGTGLAIGQTAMLTGLGFEQIGRISGAFAGGGIVGGSSYSGDNQLARVNSGEMILNGRQQMELFNLANGGGGKMQIEVVGQISGDVIRLVNKRSEYLVSKR